MSKKIGIALGGGGARAAAHIGILDAFDKAGIKIDYISGSSSGAIVAAAYAVGNLEFLKNNAAKVRKRQLIKAADFVLFRRGFFQGQRVKKVIEAITLGKDFSDTKIPLTLVATDAQTMKEVVLRSGSLTKAVMASTCIPGLFTPVEYERRSLIDGGLTNQLPTEILYQLGADFVIGVETRAQECHPLVKMGQGRPGKMMSQIIAQRFREESLNILNIIFTSYMAVVDGVAVDKLKKTRYDLLIKPDVCPIKRTDFHRAGELIEIGRKAGEQVIEKIKKML